VLNARGKIANRANRSAAAKLNFKREAPLYLILGKVMKAVAIEPGEYSIANVYAKNAYASLQFLVS
jgi:hypothetical protein